MKNKISILSYNLNGIRAATKKGFADWLSDQRADIVLIQETKAQQDQVDMTIFHDLGYTDYWFSAEKKGYSGVAILTKLKPDHIEYGMGHPLYDGEGRVIRMDYKGLSIISVYIPSGSSGDRRQDVKMQFLDDFYQYIIQLRKDHPNLIVSGDYNICHRPIDIHDPVRNKKVSGFLPEEREWMEKYFDSGMIDVFRHFNPEPHRYSWWSYRAASRARNKGWRIDYHAASENLLGNLVSADILSDAVHSDHAPVQMELEI